MKEIEKTWRECIDWYFKTNNSLNGAEPLYNVTVQEAMSKYLEGISYQIISQSQLIQKTIALKKLNTTQETGIFIALNNLDEKYAIGAFLAIAFIKKAYELAPEILPKKDTQNCHYQINKY